MTFKPLLSLFSLCMMWVLPTRSLAAVNFVSTIPELAWIASEIGGNEVSVKSILSGTENPHFVDAVPIYTSILANADVVCLVGLDLEIGYLPPLLSRSGNAKVQPGGKGYCDVGSGVTVLQKPKGAVDRSMGDVHPSGNPHFYLSPLSLKEAANQVAEALELNDGKNSKKYKEGLQKFHQKMDELSREIKLILKPLHDAQLASGNKPILIEYHQEFIYFLSQFEIKSFGSIEEKPGVPPSAARIAQVAAAARDAGVRVALGASYNPKHVLRKFSEISEIKTVVVPTMMQRSGSFSTYEALQKHIAKSLVLVLNEQTSKK